MMRIMKTPKSMDIDITDRCNLRCKYCSHFSSAGDVGKDLPTEEWLDLLRRVGPLRRHGCDTLRRRAFHP